jgi:hypothetical protein
MRMRRIILLSVAYVSLPYFSTLSNKRSFFREKTVTENKVRVLIFSTNLSETFVILRIIQRDIIKNV